MIYDVSAAVNPWPTFHVVQGCELQVSRFEHQNTHKKSREAQADQADTSGDSVSAKPGQVLVVGVSPIGIEARY